jgi:hypothetical protein
MSAMDDKPFSLIKYLTNHREWSMATFGTDQRTLGLCDHITKELAEIKAAPHDLSEWIDVAILAFDGAWRAGYTPAQIVAALVAKQAKNIARKWPPLAEQDPDKAAEHDRSKDALRPFKVGDRVLFSRRVGAESDHELAPPLGWDGVVTYNDNGDNIPLLVCGEQWSDRHLPSWYFSPLALDLVP